MKQSDIQVTLIDHMGSDLSVVNAARVSFNKESSYHLIKDPHCHPLEDSGELVLREQDVKLINYLAKHKHFSPFNHSFITCRVKAPIFVSRQLVKHRFMPWNEVSRRYVDDEPEFFIPEKYRAKAENVKQGSVEIAELDYPEYPGEYMGSHVNPWTLVEDALNLYNTALKQGIAAEQARMFLPQNMMTEWIWSGTLGAWCDMLRLRLDPHTQYESRIVAQQARALIEPIFPVSVKALLDD